MKLERICHGDKAHDLLKSYLGGREQILNIQDNFSSLIEVIYEVPQGTVLGPLLYGLYE